VALVAAVPLTIVPDPSVYCQYCSGLLRPLSSESGWLGGCIVGVDDAHFETVRQARLRDVVEGYGSQR